MLNYYGVLATREYESAATVVFYVKLFKDLIKASDSITP